MALTLFVAACTSNDPAGTEHFDSVRDRLADGPTRLYVGSAGSTGSITARRKVSDGWSEGVTPVTIDSGEVSAKVDSHGALTVDKLTVSLAPIDIPEDVFKKPAQLDNVRVSISAPAHADVTWTDDNDATLTLPLMLDFDWSIHINESNTPLATQHLPPVSIDIMLTGAGDHIDASLSLDAMGELWNWAGLLEMTKMDLSLAAGTVDE